MSIGILLGTEELLIKVFRELNLQFWFGLLGRANTKSHVKPCLWRSIYLVPMVILGINLYTMVYVVYRFRYIGTYTYVFSPAAFNIVVTCVRHWLMIIVNEMLLLLGSFCCCRYQIDCERCQDSCHHDIDLFSFFCHCFF